MTNLPCYQKVDGPEIEGKRGLHNWSYITIAVILVSFSKALRRSLTGGNIREGGQWLNETDGCLIVKSHVRGRMKAS